MVQHLPSTRPSRILGSSPFEVVFAQKPRFPLHQAARAPVAAATDSEADSDPLDHVKDLPALAQKIFDEVRRREEAEYTATRKHLAMRNTKAPRRYKIGEYVLLHRPRTEKFDMQWRGPVQVVRCITDKEYVVQNIPTTEEIRAHVSQLHPYITGGRPLRALQDEATAHNEYLVDAVLGHRRRKGELQLLLAYYGYDPKGE